MFDESKKQEKEACTNVVLLSQSKNMIGRSMKTFLHRPIKAPQFPTPGKIQKCLTEIFSFFNKTPPPSCLLHKTRDFVTCYSCSYYSCMTQRSFNTMYKHGDIILNRSNNSVFLLLKIYWNRQVFDLIRASGIWMKPETLCHQASSSKF